MSSTIEVTDGIHHHSAADCDSTNTNQPCIFHAPSDHHMRDWPMIVRETGLIERACSHGIGHPDPDSAAWFNRVLGSDAWGIHGCDGCCG